MVEPLLDLERLAAGIRWRRRTWTSFALLGLLVGVLLTVLSPPHPTAVTRVLVVHPDDQHGDGKTLMETDVALCQTSEVAGPALQAMKVNERPGDFLATYQCTGVTPNVLEITVAGTSAGDAVRSAQAVADAFIADHIKRTQDAVDAQVKALLDEQARLERSLTEVNNTISSTTNPAQLDPLYNRRAGLASQVLDLDRRAEDARIGAPTVTAGTRLVDPPRALPTRRVQTGITNAVVGLVLGLGTGLAVAAVLCVTRDRPVLRRDIAAELSVSVIAQLRAPPPGPRRLWRRSRPVRERQRLAATLARVVRGASTSVSLLEIGCPDTAAALALDIAAHITPERPVVIVDDLREGHLRQADKKARHAVEIVETANLPLDRISASLRPELYLGVGGVGPGTSWAGVGNLGSEALLVIRAGRATTLWLHTVARQLARLGISVIGVVLVQPDPRDRSDGTLWDATDTTLRDRRVMTAAWRPTPYKRPAPSRPRPRVLDSSSAHE